MHGGRASALGGIAAHKSQAKAADEAKRAEISKHIEQVFTKTKTDVGALLDGLDQQVTDVFDKGEKVARDTFDTTVGKEVDDWKDDRYSGLRGKCRWVKDKFAGLPPEVNQILRPQPHRLPGQHAKGHLRCGRRGRLDPGQGQTADRRRA